MTLHGGGHFEFKKMHKGDLWGLFRIRLGRCIIPEKISFLQFYSRFDPNALALLVIVLHTPDTFMDFLRPVISTEAHSGHRFLVLFGLYPVYS